VKELDIEIESEMIKEYNKLLKRNINELVLCLKEVVGYANSDFIDLIANPVIFKYDQISKTEDNIRGVK